MLDFGGLRGILYVLVRVFVFAPASHHSSNAPLIIGTDTTGPLEAEFHCLCNTTTQVPVVWEFECGNRCRSYTPRNQSIYFSLM
jgi:hypothetical protein